MDKANPPRIHDFEPHLAKRGPVGVQSRWQHMAESSVDPDQGTLIVFEVEHQGSVLQSPRFHDDIELLLQEPGSPLRNHLDSNTLEWIEEPVVAGVEEFAKLAVMEVESDFVSANLHMLEHAFPLLCTLGRRGVPPVPRPEAERRCRCRGPEDSSRPVRIGK